MAVRFLAREISDLCLGKPPLRSIPISATVADVLSALKRSGEIYLSVWNCDHRSVNDSDNCCRCVGKICMVDVICYLCREDNLSRPLDALQSPVSDLIPKSPGLVRHLQPHSSLLEAIDYILEGAQNLVIPIQSNTRVHSRKKLLNKPSSFGSTLHNGQEFCWLSQEDVVRFLLNSIGVFSPIPTYTVESLNIVENTDGLTVHYNEPASTALATITRTLVDQTCIAVVDEDNKLIGEISPLTLACGDETVAAAIATLSAGDLMAYIDCGGPPEDLVYLVKMRLKEKNLTGMLDLMEEFLVSSPSSSCSSCSSDEEFGSSKFTGSSRFFLARSEAIVCYPRSSLMAMMMQMIAHRVSYAWVVEDDYTLVGIVTFAGILKQFRCMAGGRSKSEGENKMKQ